MRISSLCASVGVSVVLAGAAVGCYSTVDAEPVGYAETTGAPVDIETYPSYTYNGEPVYFYGDHWWHRDGAHWARYHDEPAELRVHHEEAVRAVRARPARGHIEPHAEMHEERR